MNVQWWRNRFMEGAIALMIATGVIQLSTGVAYRQRELLPPDAWLSVNEIYVPDFKTDERPDILYDRLVRENFNAFWIVELQRRNEAKLWSTTCSGNGVNEYDPTEIIPDNTVSWPWFIGADCAVMPGVYRLRVSYSMTRPGWPEKRLLALSNEFTVSAAE